jgi:hypothetical protein
MSTSINTAFINLYGSETKLAYQREGAKLRGLVRNVSGVGGSTYRFPKLGTGVANTKARHADVTPMNLAHSNVTATLLDYYAPEYVDELDLLKTNESVRQDYAKSAAYAMGRQTDQQIIDAWVAGVTNAADIESTATGLTKLKVDWARQTLDERDVPMDGRFFVISPAAVSDLFQLTAEDFSNADFRGNAAVESNAAGRPIGRWMGFDWYCHTGLPVDGSNVRDCFAGHPSASGLAIGKEITASVDWVPEKVAWLINSKMSMGAVLIEDTATATGVVKIEVSE